MAESRKKVNQFIFSTSGSLVKQPQLMFKPRAKLLAIMSMKQIRNPLMRVKDAHSKIPAIKKMPPTASIQGKTKAAKFTSDLGRSL